MEGVVQNQQEPWWESHNLYVNYDQFLREYKWREDFSVEGVPQFNAYLVQERKSNQILVCVEMPQFVQQGENASLKARDFFSETIRQFDLQNKHGSGFVDLKFFTYRDTTQMCYFGLTHYPLNLHDVLLNNLNFDMNNLIFALLQAADTKAKVQESATSDKLQLQLRKTLASMKNIRIDEEGVCYLLSLPFVPYAYTKKWTTYPANNNNNTSIYQSDHSTMSDNLTCIAETLLEVLSESMEQSMPLSKLDRGSKQWVEELLRRMKGVQASQPSQMSNLLEALVCRGGEDPVNAASHITQEYFNGNMIVEAEKWNVVAMEQQLARIRSYFVFVAESCGIVEGSYYRQSNNAIAASRFQVGTAVNNYNYKMQFQDQEGYLNVNGHTSSVIRRENQGDKQSTAMKTQVSSDESTIGQSNKSRSSLSQQSAHSNENSSGSGGGVTVTSTGTTNMVELLRQHKQTMGTFDSIVNASTEQSKVMRNSESASNYSLPIANQGQQQQLVYQYPLTQSSTPANQHASHGYHSHLEASQSSPSNFWEWNSYHAEKVMTPASQGATQSQFKYYQQQQQVVAAQSPKQSDDQQFMQMLLPKEELEQQQIGKSQLKLSSEREESENERDRRIENQISSSTILNGNTATVVAVVAADSMGNVGNGVGVSRLQDESVDALSKSMLAMQLAERLLQRAKSAIKVKLDDDYVDDHEQDQQDRSEMVVHRSNLPAVNDNNENAYNLNQLREQEVQENVVQSSGIEGRFERAATTAIVSTAIEGLFQERKRVDTHEYEDFLFQSTQQAETGIRESSGMIMKSIQQQHGSNESMQQQQLSGMVQQSQRSSQPRQPIDSQSSDENYIKVGNEIENIFASFNPKWRESSSGEFDEIIDEDRSDTINYSNNGIVIVEEQQNVEQSRFSRDRSFQRSEHSEPRRTLPNESSNEPMSLSHQNGQQQQRESYSGNLQVPQQSQQEMYYDNYYDENAGDEEQNPDGGEGDSQGYKFPTNVITVIDSFVGEFEAPPDRGTYVGPTTLFDSSWMPVGESLCVNQQQLQQIETPTRGFQNQFQPQYRDSYTLSSRASYVNAVGTAAAAGTAVTGGSIVVENPEQEDEDEEVNVKRSSSQSQGIKETQIERSSLNFVRNRELLVQQEEEDLLNFEENELIANSNMWDLFKSLQNQSQNNQSFFDQIRKKRPQYGSESQQEQQQQQQQNQQEQKQKLISQDESCDGMLPTRSSVKTNSSIANSSLSMQVKERLSEILRKKQNSVFPEEFEIFSKKGVLMQECLSATTVALKTKKTKKIKYRNAVYEGEVISGGEGAQMLRHGTGVYRMANGDMYCGQFEMNSFSGEGVYFYSNGNIYQGHLKGGLRDGFGTYFNATENIIYSGFWLANQKNGNGRIVYANKEEFQGSFLNNSKEGIGQYRFRNGDIFQGEWRAEDCFGVGILMQSQSISFSSQPRKGYFFEDRGGSSVQSSLQQSIGSAVEMNSKIGSAAFGTGVYIHFGTMVRGKEFDVSQMNGNGVYYFENGDRYDGEYVCGVREGRGKYSYRDGRVYDGMWKSNVKHGKGRFVFADSTYYDGEFSKSMKAGYGKQTFSENEMYEGAWKGDKRNGKGVYWFADGSYYTGQWVDDEMTGEGDYFTPDDAHPGLFKKVSAVWKRGEIFYSIDQMMLNH